LMQQTSSSQLARPMFLMTTRSSMKCSSAVTAPGNTVAGEQCTSC
jgi:hypothetical protein